MGLDTQNAPKVLLGLDSERPNPSTLAEGYFFKPKDVTRLDILQIDGGIRSWVSLFGGSSVTPLVDPIFYVDPVFGNDSNSGTVFFPFATIDHALKALTPGWYGLATVRLRAGVHTLASRTVFPASLGDSTSTAGNLLFDGIDNTDSGLGTRTSNSGTTGGTFPSPVFGTVVDNVGGLTVNAWRGSFVRFTSGATLNGRCFLIASNSSTTFTICGSIPVAPTTETFVVEHPAATVTWASSEVMQGTLPVGFQNIWLAGGGGSNSLQLGGFIMGLQKCKFSSIGTGGLRLRNGSGLADLLAIQGYLGNTSIVQQCGSHFKDLEIQIRLGSTSGLGPSQVNLNRSLFENADTEHFNGTTIQYINSYFVGNSWVRMGYGSVGLISSCRFDAVTPAPIISSIIASAFGAAVVFSKRSSGTVGACDISNTPATTAPGDGTLVEDSSTIDIADTIGTGNAA